MSLLSRVGLFAWLLPLVCFGCNPQPAATPAGAAGAAPAVPPANTASASTVPAPRSAPVALQKVKLLLNWFPEAEHGGFYAAQVHGYYQEAGLDVEILPGGPNVPVVQQVARKQVQFGVVNADQICFGRAQQAPVVAVMAPLQISPRCLIVHEKSGIKKFDDIHDMTVAMSTTNAFSHFLRKKFPFKNVRIVQYTGNVAPFLQDEKFAIQGYVFSEPFVVTQQKGDPHVLMVSDVGFNPYTSCLIAHDETVKSDPELLRGMVRASVRGWRQYLQAPAETNAAIHKLNKEMSLEVLAFGVKELQPLVEDAVAKEHGLGHMSLERWQTLVGQLIEIEQLKADKVQVSELFTTEFLKGKQ